MRIISLSLVVFFLSINNIIAQSGFEIQINIENFTKDSITISYPYGDKILTIDTIIRSDSGKFVYEGNKELLAGVYFIGDFKNNKKFTLIIKPEDDHFEMNVDYNNKFKLNFIGSKENSIYRDYYLITAENKKMENLYLRTRRFDEKDVTIFNYGIIVHHLYFICRHLWHGGQSV